jgi:hypothetical protein
MEYLNEAEYERLDDLRQHTSILITRLARSLESRR